MTWTIEYSDSALKQLKKLDKQVAKKVLDYMDERVAVLDDVTQAGKPLTGRLGNLHRYRIGEIRVVCFVSREAVTVLVLRIGHRKQIYKDEDQIATKAASELDAFVRKRKQVENSEKELAKIRENLEDKSNTHAERESKTESKN